MTTEKKRMDNNDKKERGKQGERRSKSDTKIGISYTVGRTKSY